MRGELTAPPRRDPEVRLLIEFFAGAWQPRFGGRRSIFGCINRNV
jgi:hypothetical protein